MSFFCFERTRLSWLGEGREEQENRLLEAALHGHIQTHAQTRKHVLTAIHARILIIGVPTNT